MPPFSGRACIPLSNLVQDVTAAIPAEVAIALNGISHVATADLSRDLSRDLISQLNHSRAHIRKRAVAAMYKVCTQYPEAIPAGMPRMREKLEDPDPGMTLVLYDSCSA
jgi:AP-3 complex subunit delta-1